jgi:hypothetical protein
MAVMLRKLRMLHGRVLTAGLGLPAGSAGRGSAGRGSAGRGSAGRGSAGGRREGWGVI